MTVNQFACVFPMCPTGEIGGVCLPNWAVAWFALQLHLCPSLQAFTRPANAIRRGCCQDREHSSINSHHRFPSPRPHLTSHPHHQISNCPSKFPRLQTGHGRPIPLLIISTKRAPLQRLDPLRTQRRTCHGPPAPPSRLRPPPPTPPIRATSAPNCRPTPASKRCRNLPYPSTTYPYSNGYWLLCCFPLQRPYQHRPHPPHSTKLH